MKKIMNMNKTKYILVVLLTLIIWSCNNIDLTSDQDKSFVKFYGSWNSDIGADVKEYEDGYLLLATVTSVNESNKDIVLIKTDKFGNTISVDTVMHGGGNNSAGKLLLTDDGGFLLVGTYVDTLNKNKDILINKFSSGLVSEWEQTIGSVDNNEQGISVKKASDGYIIVGTTNASDAVNGNPQGRLDILMVKINETGETEWTKNHGGDGDDESSEIIVINGGYLIVGTSDSFNEPDQSAFNIIIIKTNNSGNETDKMTYGGSFNDYGHSVIRCPEGYLIVGSNENISGGNSDAYVLKVDENNIHTIVWNKAFGTTLNDKAFDVLKTQTGYIVVGEKELTSGKAAYFINIDFEGNLIYENVWGGYDQAMYSIEQTIDGGYIMTGSSGIEGNEMICLIKVNSDGEL
ncbi:MAG: hypothetical protein KOO66_06015 [Bacteroidales bacterium]|nr:hypothetical protein [Bacteroidales bacterium]